MFVALADHRLALRRKGREKNLGVRRSRRRLRCDGQREDEPNTWHDRALLHDPRRDERGGRGENQHGRRPPEHVGRPGVHSRPITARSLVVSVCAPRCRAPSPPRTAPTRSRRPRARGAAQIVRADCLRTRFARTPRTQRLRRTPRATAVLFLCVLCGGESGENRTLRPDSLSHAAKKHSPPAMKITLAGTHISRPASC